MTIEPPPGWATGHDLVPQTIGKSGATVFRAGDRFIKSEAFSPHSELVGEVARLRWLNTTGLPCPEVLDAADHAGRHWLLMTALPGRDLASTPGLTAEAAVSLAAEALRLMHAVDPAGCPFDHRAVHRVATASGRFAAGLYDGEDPADAEAHHARLLVTRPETEDLVVTHGDACLPNLMADNGRFTGFIDCGRLGVADRCQDIALAARSLEFNFGAAVLPAFYTACGVTEPDHCKLAWYRLLDEFF